MDQDSNYPPVQDRAAIQEAMEKLNGKSKSELFDALAQATREEREAGTMDNTRMDEIYEKLSPMLSESQRARMREILARLKE